SGSWSLVGGTIQGGMVAVTGTAELFATANSGNTLDGVTLFGTPANPSPLDMQTISGALVNVRDGLTLQGSTIQLGQPDRSTYAQIYFSGAAQTVDSTSIATGAINLGDNTSNGLFTYSGNTVSLSPNLTIRGNVGHVAAYSGAFDNQGTIIADPQG